MKKIMLPLFLFLQIGLVLFGVYQFDGFSDLAEAPPAQIIETPAPSYEPIPLHSPDPVADAWWYKIAADFNIDIPYQTPGPSLSDEYSELTPAPTKPRPTEPHYKYVINKYSMKFHLPDCAYAQKMNPDNKQYSNSSRAILVSLGYDPCNWCNP